jgi:hypothetical protein
MDVIMNEFKKPANFLVPTLLFILFSPDLLLSLPKESSSKVEKIFTHAAIFLATYLLLRMVFSSYY